RGNRAESYMMIGDIDKAIPYYKEALQYTSDTSAYYGLAVAYDREGEGAKARQIIKDLGDDAYNGWETKVAISETFYVPAGEVYYYRALAAAAPGNPADADTFR